MKLESIIKNFGGFLLASSLSIGCASVEKDKMSEEAALTLKRIERLEEEKWQSTRIYSPFDPISPTNREIELLKDDLHDMGYAVGHKGNGDILPALKGCSLLLATPRFARSGAS